MEKSQFEKNTEEKREKHTCGNTLHFKIKTKNEPQKREKVTADLLINT